MQKMMRLSLILSIIVASASAYEVVEPREGKCVARSERICQEQNSAHALRIQYAIVGGVRSATA